MRLCLVKSLKNPARSRGVEIVRVLHGARRWLELLQVNMALRDPPAPRIVQNASFADMDKQLIEEVAIKTQNTPFSGQNLG